MGGMWQIKQVIQREGMDGGGQIKQVMGREGMDEGRFKK